LGIVEESIAFATNFLTQILVIIAGIAAGTRYVLSELRKSNDRLGKKILGPDQDGKIGKGGLLDELRTELRAEIKREVDDLRTELIGMVNDSHRDLLNEFKRTSIKISYMSRDFSKMEKSLEKMSGGRYTAAKEETIKEYDDGFYNGLGDGDVMGDSNGDFDMDRYNKKKRGVKK
jgi:hypothetical protein